MCGASVAVGITVARDITMAMNHSSSEEPRPAAIEKKPYEKPGFRYEHVFVTSALTCGKVTSTQASCTGNTMVS
jgi:hypothetical protein